MAGGGHDDGCQQSANAGAPETPAQRQARRETRDRQNINITLYVATLLLVAAGALFIGTSLPPLLRFAGVCAVTALFYGAGFALHARVPRLKPGTVAFTGTGLALAWPGWLPTVCARPLWNCTPWWSRPSQLLPTLCRGAWRRRSTSLPSACQESI